MDVLTLLLSDPERLTRSLLRILHFLGVALGLGVTTVLDIYILRYFVFSEITTSRIEFARFLSRFVDGGLILLWLTGYGFLLHYVTTDPTLLANPKIWAKIAVVIALTLNGIIIHKVVFPTLAEQVGKRLFSGLGRVRRTIFLTLGIISGVSWYTPLALGTFSQLNGTPALSILSAYGLLLTSILLTAHAVTGMFRK